MMRALPLVALLLAPGAALAASGQSGMPQLNPNDFAPQLVWLAIVFVILYLILSRKVLPRIGEVLEDRQARIADDLDAAEKLKTDAEKAKVDYEAALLKARASAQEAVSKAREQAAADAASRRSVLDRELAAKTQGAEAEIAAAKAKALAEIRGAAVDVAQAVVQRVTGAAVSAEQVAAAIDAAARRA